MPPRPSRGGWMLALFTAAISLSAALLFVVQPMVGKMILPRGGGSPQVWVTALVFFQAALLAGYAYAHVSIRLFGARRQVLVHAVVLALPLLALPVTLPELPGLESTGRSLWVLALLTLSVGAPVFVLAAASPVLQSWLASTAHDAAEDPYFLYAGSNAGSLLGLLAYPFLVEPLLPLSVQSRLWAVGYGGFVALALVCGWVALRSAPRSTSPSTTGAAEAEAPLPPAETPARPAPGSTGTGEDLPSAPGRGDRLFWLGAAAVPSMLLVGATHYLTSRVVPVPLLWVLPLAVYLVTYILAFSRWRLVPVAVTSRGLAMLGTVAVLALLVRLEDPVWVVVTLHLAAMGVAALLCHQRLADRRPATTHLTEFYLLISAGGVLGGILGALVAPVAFDSIVEYPLALALAALFRVPMGRGRGEGKDAAAVRRRKWMDVLVPAALLGTILLAEAGLTRIDSLPSGVEVVALVIVPALVVYVFAPFPRRFSLGLMVLLLASSGQMHRGEVIFQERTFFGVYRVARDPGNSFHILYHGSTIHGIQSLEEGRRAEPLAYYHESGPAGGVVSAMARQPGQREWALVGAGTGALAAHARANQRVTLYEIDPLVVELAADPDYFDFVDQTPARVRTVVGDGRLALGRSETRYDLIVLDAFTGGSIPVHLMTREALQLYLDRLRPGGILLFHVSNRHLDLTPILANHAEDLGLVGFLGQDTRAETEAGVLASEWVLLARGTDELAAIPHAGWTPLLPFPDAPHWTDDHSNLLAVQRWF